MADLVVRDQKDYSDADAARTSLQEAYAEYPYVGIWLQEGDDPIYTMYVFTTRTASDLLAARWTLIEPA